MAESLEGQIGQALDNLIGLLRAAGLETSDIVRLAIHSKVSGAADLCARIRDEKISPGRPVVIYREVLGFARLDCLVEVEAEAIREA
jgi:enamine deaminase RidA (YjgF/YER057c/UK114 family)